MNSFRKVVWGAVTLLAAVSCKSQYDTLLSSNDVDAKYKAAFQYFDKGKYQKAASLFESMSVLTDGTEKDDTVQYYWGLSNYKFKDYITAEANFSRFVSNFPRSPFAEQPVEPEPEELKLQQEAAFAERMYLLFEKEHVYLNPRLRLSELAMLLGTNRTYLSQYFNQNCESTFYDFVNDYRIHHAKLLLHSTDGSNLEFADDATLLRAIEGRIEL